MSRRVRLSGPRLMFAIPAVGLLAALLALPTPADAQVTGPCQVVLNGVDVNLIASSEDAMEVRYDDQIFVVGANGAPGLVTEITLDFGPVSTRLPDRPHPSGSGVFEAGVSVADYSRYGVGLYRVVVTNGDCTAAGWVLVTERNPLTTVAGAVGAGLLGLGLILQVSGLALGLRRRSGLWLAVIGGLPTGVGALVLAQQFGLSHIGGDSMVIWTLGPMSIGGIGNVALSRLSSAGGAETAAPPPLEAPAPPVEAAPPPLEAPPPPIEAGPSPAEAAGPPTEGGATRDVERPTASEPAGGGRPRPEDRRDPPRSFYALLEGKEAVVQEEEFDLVVGLSPRQTDGVAGPPMRRPEWSVGPYTVNIQVIADGFSLRPGESPRVDLRVTYDSPYPRAYLHLSAAPTAEEIDWRAVRAIYSIDGHTIGMAERIVVVARTEEARNRIHLPSQPGGTDVSVPSADVPPDLTVRIVFAGPESSGALRWTLDSPYEDIKASLPAEPVETDIGADPAAFAVRVMRGVGEREGRRRLFEYVNGVGSTIADQVPEAFWEALRSVAARVAPRHPTVLILSAEPYVPWELAVVDPAIVPDAPPFLSAQAVVGRWVLGRRRPQLPPPTERRVESMAVVSGVYGGGWVRLPEAEEEAAELRRSYGAAEVQALVTNVIDCIEGNPLADVVHFAVHGQYDPQAGLEGLVLTDGAILDPFEVRGSQMAGAPFVFLNACQVGAGTAVLGDYAGMAAAFLYAGASGVVAPLWAIGDEPARQVAIRFYERALSGVPPAQVFRAERAKFTDSPHTVSATYLAYQFFGHPGMKLTGAPAPPEDREAPVG